MGTTLSFVGTLFRSNVFEKLTLRKFAGTSRDSTKEFACTIDMSSSPSVTFPLAVPIQDITTIKFLYLTVIGGTAQIRLVKRGAYTSSPSTVQVNNEVPSGAKDGTNYVYTLAHTPVTETENVYVNGVRQTPGVSADYQILTDTLIFNPSSIPPVAASILIDYYYTTGNQPVPLNTQNLDLNVSGIMVMSEIDLNSLYIMGVSSSCIVEIIGVGQ
jgi:hypothetical protein